MTSPKSSALIRAAGLANRTGPDVWIWTAAFAIMGTSTKKSAPAKLRFGTRRWHRKCRAEVTTDIPERLVRESLESLN